MDNTTTKPFAVVTGASSGIGYELAAQFAQHGFDLLVVSDTEKISDAAQRLSASGASVQPLRADLANYEGVEALCQRIQTEGRALDAIAINAGVGVSGPFAETDLSAQMNLMSLNVISPVHLTRRVLNQMITRGQGRILFTSSIAANSPGPYMATYNASKSFLKSFAEAIRFELKDSGVTVTTLMPGATETDFFRRAGLEDTKLGASEKDSAADVARQGFEALMDGKDHVVAGSFKNKVQATLAHIVPDTVAAQIHSKESEPGSAGQ